MKTTELIKALNEFVKTNGDLEIKKIAVHNKNHVNPKEVEVEVMERYVCKKDCEIGDVIRHYIKAGQEFDVLRDIYDRCVLVRITTGKSNIVAFEKELLKYGELIELKVEK